MLNFGLPSKTFYTQIVKFNDYNIFLKKKKLKFIIFWVRSLMFYCSIIVPHTHTHIYDHVCWVFEYLFIYI